MPDSLLFDGADDYVRFGAGAALGEGAYTLAVVAKYLDDSGFENLVGLNSIDSLLGTNNASPRKLTVFAGSGGASTSSFNVQSSDGWCIYAWNRPDDNFGDLHKYVFSSDTWTHEDKADGIPEDPTLTDFWLGRTGDGQSYLNGNILLAAWWNRMLSNTELETLAGGLAAWIATQPDEIWRPDSVSASGLTSLTGTATESARVGTALDAGDAPSGWSDDVAFDTGWVLCTTTSTLDTSANNWSNPGNITADDGSIASVAVPNGQSSDYLVANGYGFDLPAGATVEGVEVRIDRNYSLLDVGVNFYLTLEGTDLDSSGKGGTSGDGIEVIGGRGDLWGMTLSVAEVEASTFGVLFNVGSGVTLGVAEVDAVWMRVTYSLPDMPRLVQASSGQIATAGAQTTLSMSNATEGNVIFLQAMIRTTEGWPAYTDAFQAENLEGGANEMSNLATASVGNPSAHIHNIWAGRVTTSGTFEIDVVQVSGSGDDIIFRLYEFENVREGETIFQYAGGSPQTVDPGGTWNYNFGTSAAVADAALQTNTDLCLGLQFIAYEGSGAMDSFAGESGGNEYKPVAEYTASGLTIGIQIVEMAVPATVSGGTFAITSEDWSTVGMALLPLEAGSQQTYYASRRRSWR